MSDKIDCPVHVLCQIDRETAAKVGQCHCSARRAVARPELITVGAVVANEDNFPVETGDVT